MRFSALLALCIAFLCPPLALSAQSAPGCNPVGKISFVCGQNGPEDLIAVPGTPFLVATAYGADGGVNLIDTKAATSVRLYPNPAVKERLDSKTYDSLPKPAPRAWTARSSGPAGSIRSRATATAPARSTSCTTGCASRSRSSSSTRKPESRCSPGSAALWRRTRLVSTQSHCAAGGRPSPRPIFDPRQPPGGRGGFTPELLEGKVNGEVWEWHTGAGWKRGAGQRGRRRQQPRESGRQGKWYSTSPDRRR